MVRAGKSVQELEQGDMGEIQQRRQESYAVAYAYFEQATNTSISNDLKATTFLEQQI